MRVRADWLADDPVRIRRRLHEWLALIEFADDVAVEEVRAKTEAPFNVADDVKPML